MDQFGRSFQHLLEE